MGLEGGDPQREVAAGPALTLAPTEPAEPPKKGRRAPGTRTPAKAPALTPERLAVLVAVYQALGTARLQANMPAPHAVPYLLRKAHEDGKPPELTDDQKNLLRCLVQLEQGAHGEPMTLADAETLLVATVRAKVAEHARSNSDDERFRTGTLATIETLTRKSNFGSWLNAGRAWLASGGRPTQATSSKRGGAFTPRGEYTEL